jgi:hypothetical protein
MFSQCLWFRLAFLPSSFPISRVAAPEPPATSKLPHGLRSPVFFQPRCGFRKGQLLSSSGPSTATRSGATGFVDHHTSAVKCVASGTLQQAPASKKHVRKNEPPAVVESHQYLMLSRLCSADYSNRPPLSCPLSHLLLILLLDEKETKTRKSWYMY